MVSPFILSPFVLRSDHDAELGVPLLEHNLFRRIIRDPHTAADEPKERECAEMLTAVLLNASVARDCLLAWLAKQTDDAHRPWESQDAHIDIETEMAIGSKRDDIRITVHRSESLKILWSVEVKVGARIHESSELGAADDSKIMVSQLKNYETGLLAPSRARYPEANIAGFVLSIRRMELPPGLVGLWHVITWSQIALQLEGILKRLDLPETDAFLVKHMLGFIRQYLWRPEEVGMTNLELDDVVLMKAFGALGNECESKVNALIAPLKDIVAAVLPSKTDVKHQKSLFAATARSVVYGRLLPHDPSPWIFAGIRTRGARDSAGTANVWIETPRKTRVKDLVRSVIPKYISPLQKVDARWAMHEDGNWWDISKSTPLKYMLVEQDQAAWICHFTEKALRELKDSGLLADIIATASSPPEGTRP
jgi:hypothetical protein